MPRKLILLAALAFPAWPQAGALAPVIVKPQTRAVQLPGELLPYLTVAIHARVEGFVDRVAVDRGSVVKAGDLLAELSAPEMAARLAQAQAGVEMAESARLQAEAGLAAARSTAGRLRKASETEGAVAGNELVQTAKQVEAAEALVSARVHAKASAEAAARAEMDLQRYLKITAPFDGVVTERNVHPGALVGPSSGQALMVVQQLSRLRLVVPVPEADLGGIARGTRVSFQVPAFPDRHYTATIARNGRVMDPATRAMAVELDVANTDGSLAPGMYPNVKWSVRGSQTGSFVPRTAVVTTTERTFVIRVENGKAAWVDVRKGAAEGDLVEVTGGLRPGDMVVRRGTDELRDGAAFPAK